MNVTRMLLTFGSLALIIPTVGLTETIGTGGNSGRFPCAIGFDANHDGNITRAEVMAMRSAHFDTADRNGDGYLTVDELSGLPRRGPGMGRGALLARMDTNHDGRLSKEEFVNFVPPRLAAMGLGERDAVASPDAWMRPGWRYGMWAR